MGVVGQYKELHEAQVCETGKITKVLSYKLPANHVAFIEKLHFGVMDKWGTTVSYGWRRGCYINLKIDGESIIFHRNVGTPDKPENLIKPLVAESTIEVEFYNPSNELLKLEAIIEMMVYEKPIDY